MKMREKFKDEIVNYEGENFCEDILKKIVLSFYGKECKDIRCSQCRTLFVLWLDEEYTEPEKTFECDELVEVSHDGENWHKKYYAYKEIDSHYCWAGGRTSKTATSRQDVRTFECIRKCEQ